MELKSLIICRYGSPTTINHPKTSHNIDKSTFKCTYAIRPIPPVWISHNFKAMTLEGFQENLDCNCCEIKTKANVLEKASALVVSPLRPSSQKIVPTANGNTTPIIGEGSLTLIDTLNLDSVLVVSSLDYNLLSVSQITAVLSCIVIFWPEFCVIKDIQTRQTIGCGIKRGKLYYLDLQSKDSNKLQQALMARWIRGGEEKSEIWLWHRRLGHASFGYLKIVS
ncbi:hypothetical protein AAG906_026166 [Vitis piasezkii]